MVLIWLWCALAGAALTLVQAVWLVPRLPEPADGSRLGKTTYASLTTRRRLAVLVVACLAAQLATAAQPPDQRGLWLVLGSSVLTLIWVDGLTTWVPTPLARCCLAQLVIAAALTPLWADDVGPTLLHALFGAAASWGLWWLIWRLTRGGIGYGDVRLAPLLGAATGAAGINTWLAALLAGSLAGVIWGLAARRRAPAPGTRTGFAYGPALWIGPYAALAWMWLISR